MGPLLRGFARFWAGLVFGDDWVIAATVAGALLGTWGLAAADLPAWWLLPAAVVCAAWLSLRRAAHPRRRGS
jgi:hypothetical protein